MTDNIVPGGMVPGDYSNSPADEREKITLPYGCNKGLPEGVRVAWGARFIWPDDMLYDRQGCDGGEPGGVERRDLLAWLDAGAGAGARVAARVWAESGRLTLDSDETVTLYKDEYGKVVGSPQSSHGYLYVAAWLFEHVNKED